MRAVYAARSCSLCAARHLLDLHGALENDDALARNRGSGRAHRRFRGERESDAYCTTPITSLDRVFSATPFGSFTRETAISEMIVTPRM